MNRQLPFYAVGIFLQSCIAQAQAPDTKAMLDLITNTADRICYVIADKGSTSSTEVKGAVNVELGGLAARLAKAGVQGSGGITNDEYQNVLREQLPNSIRESAVCKLKVFESLQAKLITSPSPPLAFPPPVPKPHEPDYIGEYYLYGDGNKKCYVSRSGDGLLFRNEHGDVVLGSIVANNVTVTKWPVAGTYGDGYIFWRPNYTLWSKMALSTEQVTDAMAGWWIYAGRSAQVVREGFLVFAVNENGSKSRLVNAGSPLSWRALDWGNLTAIVTPNAKTIFWGNGTIWAR